MHDEKFQVLGDACQKQHAEYDGHPQEAGRKEIERKSWVISLGGGTRCLSRIEETSKSQDAASDFSILMTGIERYVLLGEIYGGLKKATPPEGKRNAAQLVKLLVERSMRNCRREINSRHHQEKSKEGAAAAGT